jgi:protein-S-isoprenylcysteine O-methyltransferase Ste14
MINSIQFEDERFFLILTDILLFVNVCIRIYFIFKTFYVKKAVNHESCISKILSFISFGCLLICLVLYHLNIFIFNNIKYTQLNIPVWLRWCGAVLFLIGDILFYFVHSYLGRSWSGFIVLLDDHKLIKNGPYKYMGHPMYTSILLVVISIFLLTTSWLLTLTFLFVFLVAASRIPKEEKLMLNQFGDEYREYKKTTGILFPSLSSILSCGR